MAVVIVRTRNERSLLGVNEGPSRRHARAGLRRRGVTIVTEPFELPVIGRRLAVLADQWGSLIELAQVLA